MSRLYSVNPLDQSVVGDVAVTTQEQLTQVVERAKIGQQAWAKRALSERAQQLSDAYKKLLPHQAQLATLISQEMGKDFRRASYEAHGVVQSAAYMIEEAVDAFQPERLAAKSELQYRALGVVGVISPWNYPLAMANNLLIPALVAGNSVILKPSEQTPLIADLFIQTLQSQLPEGVLQIVHGDGQVGQALVQSDIHMIAFTGSVAAGRNIMANAAPQLKRLVMELGGNDPMIVLASADIKAAARFAVASSFENAGQICTSTERVYVDQSIADAFYQQVMAHARNYQTGGWDEPGVNIGPLASADQHQRVVSQLQDAEQKGARFLMGQADYPLPFVEPTVVSGMTPDMQLEQTETFGPVVAMAEFEHVEEAIERANDSIYGLGAVIFGGKDAAAVAEQLEAGMVSVNQGVGGPGDSPWVGAKQSGFGFHGSKAGHRQFSQVRVINF